MAQDDKTDKDFVELPPADGEGTEVIDDLEGIPDIPDDEDGDDFGEPYEEHPESVENPVTSQKDRLEKVETGLADTRAILGDVVAGLAAIKDAVQGNQALIPANHQVLEPSMAHNIASIQQIAKIYNDLQTGATGNITAMANAFIQMGQQMGQHEAAASFEEGRANDAYETLVQMRTAMDEKAASGQATGQATEILTAVTPIVDKLIDILASFKK